MLTVPLLLFAFPLLAQVNQDREETMVDSWELEADETRPNLAEEAAQGPTTSALSLDREIDIADVERTEASLSRLQRLVNDTPQGDRARAGYMFRLAELFYDRARFYEQRAYQRRDEAHTLRDLNPQRARAYDENADADLEQSDVFANQAISLYAEIYRDFGDSFPEIDAVLYYLGANMHQLGLYEAALTVFENLASSYPQSAYLPQALLMTGELYWSEGDLEQAQLYYEAVTQIEDAPGYAYALYKLAWCEYNLSTGPDDFASALQRLYDTVVAIGDDQATGRVRLRRDALFDMALFYAEIYRADRALDFFTAVAPDESFALVARLARIYGDRAEYSESNALYRTLIGLNSSSFDIVEYQQEIVRNTRPSANHVEIVREVRRLMELYRLASGFADADTERVTRTGTQLELLLRQLSTTYHREAQVTKNEQFYALAYALYEDYAQVFPESPYAYQMWFYFGELLYRNRDWLQAAEAYESALRRSTAEQNQYDQELTHAACLAYANMVDMTVETSDATAATVPVDQRELAPTPEAMPIPDEYLRMMNACDRYLATGPEPERAVEIEYVIAYTYYDYYHLDEASSRFATLAMGRTGVDLDRARASANLLLDTLALERKYDDMQTWIERFQGNPALNAGPFALRLRVLGEQINFLRCEGMYADRRYEDAGHCYRFFVEQHYRADTHNDMVCQGLYNAGLSYDRAGKFNASIAMMGYLPQLCPNDSMVPETVYQLGQVYYRMGMYDEAAQRYRDYVRSTPRGDNVRHALINESTIRIGLQDYAGGITALENLIRRTDSNDAEGREIIAESRFQIAMARRASGDRNRAIAAFEEVVSRDARVLPGRALEAQLQIGQMREAANDRRRADGNYRAVLSAYEGLSPETKASLNLSARSAAAEAQFMLAERIFEEFEAIPIRGTDAQIQRATEQKMELGTRARELYNAVIGFGSPGWSIAALTRSAQFLHVFYEQIIDAEIPSGMTPLQIEEYQTLISERAEAIKDEAMTLYEEAIMVAREVGWFSEYSTLAATLYQQLNPGFRAGSEMRIEPGRDVPLAAYTSPWVFPAGFEPRERAVEPPPSPAPTPASAPGAAADPVEEVTAAADEEL